MRTGRSANLSGQRATLIITRKRAKNNFENTAYPTSRASRRPHRYPRTAKFWLFLTTAYL